jgi:hypothetical protein
MIGCITQEARAQAEKGRKKRERQERERRGEYEPGSDAHAMAEGAVGDCPPDLGKGFENVGITTGPGQPVMPGQISPQDFDQPYIQAGHGAPSPSQGPPNTPHVDLRGDRGMARPLSPHAPLPVEGPR